MISLEQKEMVLPRGIFRVRCLGLIVVGEYSCPLGYTDTDMTTALYELLLAGECPHHVHNFVCE